MDYSTALNIEKLGQQKLGLNEFDDVISDNAQYGRIQFWDNRYTKFIEPFEWYYGYEYFKDTIHDNIPMDWKVMVAGCGSSNMVGDMADDGYKDITASDISRVLMAQLRVRYKDYPQINYFQGTMLDTDLPEESYNAIIDKALFDSLLCSQMGPINVAQYVIEVERLLKDDGVFILISYGNPEQRLHFLEQYDIEEPFFTPWIVEVQALVKPREFEAEELDPIDPNSLYFVYVCRKSEDLVRRKKVAEKRIATKKTKKMVEAAKIKAPNLK